MYLQPNVEEHHVAPCFTHLETSSGDITSFELYLRHYLSIKPSFIVNSTLLKPHVVQPFVEEHHVSLQPHVEELHVSPSP